VALILVATLLAGSAERLAWTTSCPNRSRVFVSCEPECVAPSSNSGEEVALVVAPEIVRTDFKDAAVIDISWGNEVALDEVSQPICGERLELVVVRSHQVQCLI